MKCALSLLALAALRGIDAAGTNSKLQVQIPVSFRKADGYEHREAMFGRPPYGGSIEQNVKLARSNMCNGQMSGFSSSEGPYIMMIERGECTFVQKVRNAQRAGASAVIIADNKCLCSAGPNCTSTETEKCEPKEPMMGDDGSGQDITIPSFLMVKQDADDLVDFMKSDNGVVRMKMSWELPQPDARVEYELWSTPMENISLPIQLGFKEAALKLGGRARFTPHMFVYDGTKAGCRGVNGVNQCSTLCTNNGRYCSTDPDDDLDKGLSGADVVAESLRRICIWKEYGTDGVGSRWFEYVQAFRGRCNTVERFNDRACLNEVMQRVGISSTRIDECMSNSGGLVGDGTNSMLEAEIEAQQRQSVVILPTVLVNRVAIRGALTPSTLFGAVCAGYAPGQEPAVCRSCAHCMDTMACVDRGLCLGHGHSTVVVHEIEGSDGKMYYSQPDNGGGGGMSWNTFFSGLMFVTLSLAGMSIYFIRKTRSDARERVRDILAEYMPLDGGESMGSSGMSQQVGWMQPGGQQGSWMQPGAPAPQQQQQQQQQQQGGWQQPAAPAQQQGFQPPTL